MQCKWSDDGLLRSMFVKSVCYLSVVDHGLYLALQDGRLLLPLVFVLNFEVQCSLLEYRRQLVRRLQQLLVQIGLTCT